MSDKYVLTNGHAFVKCYEGEILKKTCEFSDVKIFTSLNEANNIKNRYSSALVGYDVSAYDSAREKYSEKEWARAQKDDLCVLRNSSFYFIGHDKTKTKEVIDAVKFTTKKTAEEYRLKHPSKTKGYEAYTISEIMEMEKERAEIEKTTRRQFTVEERKEVYKKTKGKCYICGEFVDFEDFQIEHKLPLAKGGTNEIENLYCACKCCNQLKQSYLYEDFMDQITKIFINQLKKKVGFLPYILTYFISKKY